MNASDRDFAEAVRSNISIAGVIRSLGRALVGSNYRYVRREVERLGLRTDHWLGQAHGTSARGRRGDLGALLVEGSSYNTGLLKKRLIEAGLLKNQCYACELPPVWRGKPLVLRLDHINGIRDDARIENLRLLCPNCDSQTDTYCGRNRAKSEVRACSCGVKIGRGSSRCKQCASAGVSRSLKVEWPSLDELVAEIERTSVVAVARRLGVSDNAVRKHIRTRSRAREVQGDGF